MNFSNFLNESKDEIKSLSDVGKNTVGISMGQVVKIDGVKMVMNGSRGGKHILDVREDGTVKDGNGRKIEVNAGDKLYVDDDATDIEIKKDTRKYLSVEEAIEHVQERIKVSLKNLKIKSREDFVKQITSIAELVSYDLPQSFKDK